MINLLNLIPRINFLQDIQTLLIIDSTMNISKYFSITNHILLQDFP